MDKSISVYFGYLTNPKERLQKIKDAGFDSIITSADPKWDWQNGTLPTQLKLAKKLKLKTSSLHAAYDDSQLKYFFEEGVVGDKVEKNIIKDLKLAKKYGFKSLVVHFIGKPSLVGIERIKRILTVCQKVKIPLAVENLKNSKVIDYIFDHISDKYLGLCYDAGNNHAYDPAKDYLAEYGNRLVAVHLHDNDGCNGQYTLDQFGTIDWKVLAKKLAHCKEVSLDYELLMHNHNNRMTEELALTMCYKNACKLEDMINKERQKLLNKKG